MENLFCTVDSNLASALDKGGQLQKNNEGIVQIGKENLFASKGQHPAKKIKMRIGGKVKDSKNQKRRMDVAKMNVTPKFREIPDCVNVDSTPLDSESWRNTTMRLNDPQVVPGISQDIYKYLKRVERLSEPGRGFMSRQVNINWQDRAIQVDWMLRLCHEMRLRRDTFYLAVSLMDRYLELKTIEKKDFDTLSLSCLFCAAKYEEMVFPTVKDFVFLSGDVLTPELIFQKEMEILETLGWRINQCNPMTFFDQLSLTANLEPKVYHFSQFAVETLIYKGVNSRFCNSLMGAAVLLLSYRFFGLEKLPYNQIKSLYFEHEVEAAAKEIWNTLKEVWGNSKEDSSAVVNKFGAKFYSEISKVKQRINEDFIIQF